MKFKFLNQHSGTSEIESYNKFCIFGERDLIIWDTFWCIVKECKLTSHLSETVSPQCYCKLVLIFLIYYNFELDYLGH